MYLDPVKEDSTTNEIIIYSKRPNPIKITNNLYIILEHINSALAKYLYH
jgi:hypothetical protein